MRKGRRHIWVGFAELRDCTEDSLGFTYIRDGDCLPFGRWLRCSLGAGR